MRTTPPHPQMLFMQQRPCRALRIHISEEIERRLMLAAQRQLQARGQELDAEAVDRLLDLVQRRYFDGSRSPGKKALDNALAAIVRSHDRVLSRVGVSLDEREALMGVMRRFLRVRTTLVRCFPLAEFETVAPLTPCEEYWNTPIVLGCHGDRSSTGSSSF